MYNYGYGISPYQSQMAQNRLNGMEQQQQQYMNNMYNQPQMQLQSQQATQSIKGRPVSNYDEAKASMIDLDGSLFVFTDVTNKKVYTKQIMLDGSAELKTYVLEQTPISETKKENEYVSREEFEQQIQEINCKISGMEGYENGEDRTDAKSNVRKQSNVSKG